MINLVQAGLQEGEGNPALSEHLLANVATCAFLTEA